ncbi:MAG: hypothetical protein MdMp014T_1918 [Treponematales bacterium]
MTEKEKQEQEERLAGWTEYQKEPKTWIDNFRRLPPTLASFRSNIDWKIRRADAPETPPKERGRLKGWIADAERLYAERKQEYDNRCKLMLAVDSIYYDAVEKSLTVMDGSLESSDAKEVWKMLDTSIFNPNDPNGIYDTDKQKRFGNLKEAADFMIKAEARIHPGKPSKTIQQQQSAPPDGNAPAVYNTFNLSGSGNQINVAHDGATVTATQNNGYNLAELQALIDSLLQSIPDNTPQEIVEQVKENLQFIQTEVQSPAPRRNIMKTILTGLVNGTIQAAGFLANLATLAQFLGI